MEKARRKAEGDLKMTIDNLNEMERSKLDLEEVVKKYVCVVFRVVGARHCLRASCLSMPVPSTCCVQALGPAWKTGKGAGTA